MSIPAFSGCKLGSYCSGQARTNVGKNNTEIYHRTVTTLTGQGPAYTGAKTETYIISKNAAGIDEWVLAATTTDGGKTQTFTSAAGADLKKSMVPGGNLYKNTQAQVQTTLAKGGQQQGAIPVPGQSGSLEKITSEQQKKAGIIPQSTATNAGIESDSTEGASDIEKEAKGESKKNTRPTYDILQYPLKLKLENQDCIKFSIIEYKAPGLKPNSSEAGSRIVQLNKDTIKRPGLGNRTILGTITLPIPSGIGDRNSADWQGNPLDEITQFFAGISMQGILGGGQAAANTADKSGASLIPGGDTSALQSRLASTLVEKATGANGILARQFGAVANPNMELLFNGPSLRSFTFNFRFTPRESQEAVAVRKIIRQFKQAMSVKRSSSSLLLKAPHTFAISYLSKNTDHPYLNKFKECALTDCSVSYTPDGTYMTYTDSSMTAYELSLTFQELEPIFDDEYYELDKNQDTLIGF